MSCKAKVDRSERTDGSGLRFVLAAKLECDSVRELKDMLERIMREVEHEVEAEG